MHWEGEGAIGSGNAVSSENGNAVSPAAQPSGSNTSSPGTSDSYIPLGWASGTGVHLYVAILHTPDTLTAHS